ncbi:hypothetical protein DL765_008856 [Monosporascus sp. GIB2]|nr:hypothetical protein DL765_008856 [Monosporascus sp. GIB2]
MDDSKGPQGSQDGALHRETYERRHPGYEGSFDPLERALFRSDQGFDGGYLDPLLYPVDAQTVPPPELPVASPVPRVNEFNVTSTTHTSSLLVPTEGGPSGYGLGAPHTTHLTKDAAPFLDSTNFYASQLQGHRYGEHMSGLADFNNLGPALPSAHSDDRTTRSLNCGFMAMGQDPTQIPSPQLSVVAPIPFSADASHNPPEAADAPRSTNRQRRRASGSYGRSPPNRSHADTESNRSSTVRRRIKDHPILYTCNLESCGETFTLRKDLMRHQMTSRAHAAYRSASDTKFCVDERCRSYGREFSRPDNYERHVRSMHRWL